MVYLPRRVGVCPHSGNTIKSGLYLLFVMETLSVTRNRHVRGIRDEQRDFRRNMDMKERKSHRIYIQALRQMSPEKRLLRAFELSEFTRDLFYHGLRKRFPELSEEKLRELFLKRLEKCHNRNY